MTELAEVFERIRGLEGQVEQAENWETKFELLDKIWKLKVEAGIVKPVTDDYQCEGCSA